MINWRERFIATAIHFGVTLTLAGIAAGLIFFVWFPDPFQTMIGGTELFLLVVGCDLALGPLMSLVVYDSRKSRGKLIFDYSVLGVLQIGALIYGVSIVAIARPVYVVFNSDRYEVVMAGDINEKELAAARDPQYAKLPWRGPKLIAVNVPPAERNDALFESLNGNEEHQRPKFYVPLSDKVETIRKRAKPLAALLKKKPEAGGKLAAAEAASHVPAERLAWLPVRHRNGFWTALVDTADGKPVAWVDVDPY